MTRLVLFAFVAAASGCGPRRAPASAADGGAPGVPTADAMADDVRAADGNVADHARAGAFCSGAAKAELNGERLAVLQVSGEVIAMGCCDGAAVRFEVGPADPLSSRRMVLWAGIRSFGGANPGLPTALSLAALPAGWELQVRYHPCAPPDLCAAEIATLSAMNDDVFQGSIDLDGTSFYDGTMRVALCLEAAAGARSEHALRSVRLWAREVLIGALP